jgi:hypothetical protein
VLEKNTIAIGHRKDESNFGDVDDCSALAVLLHNLGDLLLGEVVKCFGATLDDLLHGHDRGVYGCLNRQ